MKQQELYEVISKLETNHVNGELTIMEVVYGLFDIEYKYKIAPEEIAVHISDEDIKDNYLDISRPKIKRR